MGPLINKEIASVDTYVLEIFAFIVHIGYIVLVAFFVRINVRRSKTRGFIFIDW